MANVCVTTEDQVKLMDASDERSSKELFLAVALYLKDSPFTETAEVFERELVRKQLLPRRTDWEGKLRYSSLQEIARNLRVGSRTLPDILGKTVALARKAGVFGFPELQSLIGSCLGSFQDPQICDNSSKVFGRKLSYSRKCQVNSFYLLQSNELCPSNRGVGRVFHAQHWGCFKLLHSVLGHLAPIYCLAYDLTGKYVLTGADDNLVKVWSHMDGRLLATLRGHSAEVSDIAVSLDNSLIASASNDKTVRVWCSRTGSPIAVLAGHTGIVTSVQFIPASRTSFRYLVSTGADGLTIFWRYSPDTLEFESSPVKFMEKLRIGDRTLCSSHSPGGVFFASACGSFIRVYSVSVDTPELQAELDKHSDQVTVMSWGKSGRLCFVSGSRDGTAKVWHFEQGCWKDVTLPACGAASRSDFPNKWKKLVTMVSFDCTDTYVITASSPDCIVKVWQATTGDFIRSFEYHSNEVFALEAHPSNPRYLISAGHDGYIVLWDILTGERLNNFSIEFEDEGSACVYDVKFSPSGDRFAAVDSQGHLLLFGFGSRQPYLKFPKEQFFHTDYRPLVVDAELGVVDEQAQMPPHLMPPPVLVNIDGDPHSMKGQVGILEFLQRPRAHKKEVMSSSGLVDELEGQTVGISWSSCLSQSDYEEAVRLWKERTVVAPVDGHILQSVLLAFDELSAMEERGKEKRTSCRSPAEEVTLSDIGRNSPVLRVVDSELSDAELENQNDVESSITDSRSSASSSDGSDDSLWIIDSDHEVTPNLRKRRCSVKGNTAAQSREQEDDDRSLVSDSMDEEPGVEGPSKWLSQTKPLAQPYCPQIGDSIVYFPQGHMLYLDAVKSDNVYSLKGYQPPWKDLDLRDHEFCIVAEVEYNIGPPVTCTVTLVQQPSDSSTWTSLDDVGSFRVRYHDMESVLDFILLRSTFDQSMSREWEPGRPFHSFIDGSWWTGTVVARTPFSQDWPETLWLCYSVLWEDGNQEGISPWDMCTEPSQEVDDDNVPLVDRKHQSWAAPVLQSLLQGLQFCVESMPESLLFREPVDLDVYRDYCRVVPAPMDLSTIKARLENFYYRQRSSILFDVLIVFRNALLYNEEDSELVSQAAVLVHTLSRFVRDETADIASIYDDVSSASPESLIVEAKQWNDNCCKWLFQDALSSQTSSWVRGGGQCLLDSLLLEDFAAPFIHPVDRTDYEDYFAVIEEPMNLMEMSRKLSTSEYATPVDFISDFELIISNSMQYNTDFHSLMHHMTVQMNQWLKTQLPKFWSGALLCLQQKPKNNQEQSTNSSYEPIATRLRKRLKETDSDDSSSLPKKSTINNEESSDMHEPDSIVSFSKHGRRIRPAFKYFDS